MVKETVILYTKKSFEEWKKFVSLINLKVMKTRKDCEIACDCVKHANVVLHVGLCKEIFARKPTATHKPTSRSAQPLIVTTMTHIRTHTHIPTSVKIASRCEAPRPPMTDVGTETASRLASASISEIVNIPWGQRSVDAIFTCVDLHVLVSRSIKPSCIWTSWMLIDRQMQSAFMPELHRWISKLTARHLQGPPRDLLITMVKLTVILYQKEFQKLKKSHISHWSERDENAKWLRDCLWLCQACKRGFTCRPM